MRGDAAGAQTAYRQAITSGGRHRRQAALNLGNLLAADGQLAEAERWFHAVLRSGHGEAAPKAGFEPR
jgi:Flp pilus assembly protein TadD